MMISKLAAQVGGVFQSSGVRSAVRCAAIGSAALMTFAAHAVVVTSPAANLVVPPTFAGIYINVVTGVTNTTASFAGYDINPYGTGTLTWFSPAAATTGGYVGGGVTSLPVGSVVGSSAAFSNGTAGYALGSTNYFGFRFVNEANGLVHYGYGTVTIGSTATDRTIGSLFYESVAGASITVSPVPEPASVAMMLLGGLGVAGVVARRRRQSAA